MSPQDIPANEGFAAAERHFSQTRLMPDILMVESDHDMRNPTDFLVLNKVAKAIFRIKGISRVQGITRPEGTPIATTSIPFLLSLQGASQVQMQKFQNDRNNDMLTQADGMASMISILQQQYDAMRQLHEVTLSMIDNTLILQQITAGLRDSAALFDDFFRPIRNYFYWEPHCYDIPICFSLRSIFDSLDGIDQLSDKLANLVDDMERVWTTVTPQTGRAVPQVHRHHEAHAHDVADDAQPRCRASSTRRTSRRQDSAPWGRPSTRPRTTTPSILPPEVFENPDFKRAMDSFLSPDGKSARFIISHNGDPATPEGIAAIEPDQDSRPRRRSRGRPWRRQDLPRRRGLDCEGLAGRLEVRPVDRGNRRAMSGLHHHARSSREVSSRPW